MNLRTVFIGLPFLSTCVGDMSASRSATLCECIGYVVYVPTYTVSCSHIVGTSSLPALVPHLDEVSRLGLNSYGIISPDAYVSVIVLHLDVPIFQDEPNSLSLP
jgi:hypothetical protein